MRYLLAAAGSRGDFQPLLALAVGLQKAGHHAMLAASPNFASEAAAFGVEFHAVGMDVERYLREARIEMTPVKSALTLFRLAQTEIAITVDGLVPLAKRVDVVVGGGAQLGAGTAAELAGVPYRFVAYTPQMLPSARHAPFVVPVVDAPQAINRALWATYTATVELIVGRPLAAKRKALGLPRLASLEHHLLRTKETLLACDPELAEVPADLEIGHPPLGAFHLPDDRALGPEVTDFLERGAPPVYVGFGSMADKDASATTRVIFDAARELGTRVILSAGWAGLGATDSTQQVLVVGALSHRALFPRCSAIVHHGGAGTLHAAARAGVRQLVVPHAFDQFLHARWVERAGLGPGGLPRPRLTPRNLVDRLRHLLGEPSFGARADQVGAAMRARDGVARAVEILGR